jgi:hypothetical protein
VKPAAGYRPLAYSSPEAVQTTGTVAVIGIEVGKHDKAGAIEDVGGGYRQHPTFRYGLLRIGVAQCQVRGLEALWDGKAMR